MKTMRILAIDPGPEKSAWCTYNAETGRVEAATCDNKTLIEVLEARGVPDDAVAIEMIASYGMAVGREVFETCVWIGRYVQALRHRSPSLIYRREVKLHLCGNPRANDGNIRQALIDRFGPGKEKAIGKKATPGPLYGIKGDEWAALAVAVTYLDLR